MPPFPIVDAHVHLYDPGRLRYGWMDQVPALRRPHGPAELDAALGPVVLDAFVFVEVAVDPGLHLAEAAWVGELAGREPRLGAIVAHAPVEQGARVAADLERLAATGRLRGIRRLIQDERDGGICLEPGFVEGVRTVGRHGLVFELCVRHWQLVFAVELVRRCPDVTFVLDHLGKPGIRLGLLEPWRSQIRMLAELPNVVAKLSGVITEADHATWTPADLEPWLVPVLEDFGPERVMFGSDWPVSTLTHDYPRWVEVVDGLVAQAGEAARRAVLARTARRVYRW